MTTVHPFTDAPVVFLIGYGFRPAYMPADYIGPRLDCPMWLPTPDSDAAYLAKYDAPTAGPIIPDTGYAWGTWIPASPAQITASSLAGPTPAPAVWHPVTPSQPWWPADPLPPVYPCNCITTPPDLPPIAPVPVPAAAPLLLVTIAALFIIRRLS